MVSSKLFFLSLLLIVVLAGCEQLSNETYHQMLPDDRRKLSSQYTQLAKRLESGSSKNMRLLEKAVRINNQNDQAHFELSLPYLYNGIYDKWHYHISKATELNPQAWQGWRGYYKLFYLRDYGAALFDLDATDTLTIDQTDYAHNMSVDYLRGLCYMGLGNHDKAREYLKLYIEKETKDVGRKFIDETAFLYLAIMAYDEGDFDQALDDINESILYEEGQAEMYFYRAKSLVELNRFSEAKQAVQKADSLFNEGRYLRGYFHEMPNQIYKQDLDQLKEKLKANQIKEDLS
ncbi:MAG: tetratricopeptide repeat protein [Saprospiraceae bacterium]|nr:tetratricopeptide repeat protein [Saprospiraceae bacterium]